jgi:hypothetical protein
MKDLPMPVGPDIEVSSDPAEVSHRAKHRRIEMSRGDVGVEIFEACRLRERGDPQSLTEASIVAFGQLMLQQHGEAFLEP